MQMMVEVEGCGVVTRFPHHSGLYRLLLSKDWMAHLCLMPGMAIPATTKVPRGLIAANPRLAATTCMNALRGIQAGRAHMLPNHSQPLPADETCGVAKLGFSWEACDVRKWKGEENLAVALHALVDQPLCIAPSVLVQEFITFDTEIRFYFATPNAGWDADSGKPIASKPDHILYTRFCSVDEEGKMRDFERMPRSQATKVCFDGDEAAAVDAETTCIAMAGLVLFWMQTECCEPPPFIRLDFMVKKVGAGKSKCMLGEITELGASFLGWPDGPKKVFRALLASCFRDPLDDMKRNRTEALRINIAELEQQAKERDEAKAARKAARGGKSSSDEDDSDEEESDE
jgi:hypothetical protein